MLYLMVRFNFRFEGGDAASISSVGLESTLGTIYQKDPDTIAFSTIKLTKIS